MSNQNPPRPRETVAAIPAYVAGKPPAPRPGQQVYKLSSNENPYPPLPGVVEAVEAAAARMNRYPDMGNNELYDALADRLGVSREQLAAGTGSVAVLYHLLQAFCEPGDEVVYAWRSFEAYPIAVSATGAVSVQVPVTADGRHDLEAMAARITDRTKAVIVCTPNNPTGPSVTDTDLRALRRAGPGPRAGRRRRGLPRVRPRRRPGRRPGPPGSARQRRGDAHLRQGLRAGRASGSATSSAHPEVAAAVRACALPFGVSSVAQAAAVASLAAEAELFERVDAIVAERDRVRAALTDQGWVFPEPQGNFVWLPLVERTAEFVARGRGGRHHRAAVRRRGRPGEHRRAGRERPAARGDREVPPRLTRAETGPGKCLKPVLSGHDSPMVQRDSTYVEQGKDFQRDMNYLSDRIVREPATDDRPTGRSSRIATG